MRGKTSNLKLQTPTRGAPEPPKDRGGLALVTVFATLLLLPAAAYAHGELLIRIGALSRQIATNPAPQLYLNRGELYREDRNWEAAERDYFQAAKLGVPLDSVDFCRAQL